MKFSQPMNFTQLGYTTFQSISFLDPTVTLGKFNVAYNIINSYEYTIVLNPIGIIFMQNTTIVIKTKSSDPTVTITSDYNIPISDSCYNKESSIVWTLVNPPPLNDQEQNIVSSLSAGSSAINYVLGTKYVQDIKMIGLPLLALPFLMLPSMMMSLNVIYP